MQKFGVTVDGVAGININKLECKSIEFLNSIYINGLCININKLECK